MSNPFITYARAFNPLDLAQYIGSVCPDILRKLKKVFSIEAARSIKLRKEDTFILKYLEGHRKSNALTNDLWTVIDILQSRKHFLKRILRIDQLPSKISRVLQQALKTLYDLIESLSPSQQWLRTELSPKPGIRPENNSEVREDSFYCRMRHHEHSSSLSKPALNSKYGQYQDESNAQFPVASSSIMKKLKWLTQKRESQRQFKPSAKKFDFSCSSFMKKTGESTLSKTQLMLDSNTTQSRHNRFKPSKVIVMKRLKTTPNVPSNFIDNTELLETIPADIPQKTMPNERCDSTDRQDSDMAAESSEFVERMPPARMTNYARPHITHRHTLFSRRQIINPHMFVGTSRINTESSKQIALFRNTFAESKPEKLSEIPETEINKKFTSSRAKWGKFNKIILENPADLDYYKTSPENIFKKSQFTANTTAFSFNHNPSQFNKKRDYTTVISVGKNTATTHQVRPKRTVKQLKQTVCCFIEKLCQKFEEFDGHMATLEEWKSFIVQRFAEFKVIVPEGDQALHIISDQIRRLLRKEERSDNLQMTRQSDLVALCNQLIQFTKDNNSVSNPHITPYFNTRISESSDNGRITTKTQKDQLVDGSHIKEEARQLFKNQTLMLGNRRVQEGDLIQRDLACCVSVEKIDRMEQLSTYYIRPRSGKLISKKLSKR